MIGQQFYLAEQRGDWSAVYYRGIKAWLYNPRSHPVAVPSHGALITPRSGKTSIQVYGAAYPSPADYAADGVPVALPLCHHYSAGQVYVAWGQVRAQDYYAVTFNSPQDYKVVENGSTLYRSTIGSPSCELKMW